MVFLEENKQLGSIPLWGPNYIIKFGLNINSFGDAETLKLTEILKFTAMDKTFQDNTKPVLQVVLSNHHEIGVIMWAKIKIPGGSLDKYGLFGVGSDVKVDENRWYEIEIKQENVRILVVIL